jgi:hypothetical protein
MDGGEVQMRIIDYAERSRVLLNQTPIEKWAEVFVKLRLEFADKCSGGLIFSTVHGAEFFDNVVECYYGEPWFESDEEKKGKKTELGNNFRTLIKRAQKETYDTFIGDYWHVWLFKSEKFLSQNQIQINS